MGITVLDDSSIQMNKQAVSKRIVRFQSDLDAYCKKAGICDVHVVANR